MVDIAKVLVVGAGGMLGQDVTAAAGRSEWFGDQVRVVGVDVDEVDIVDSGQVERVVERDRPGVVINCAAYTDVDGCEDHRETAFAVNAAGVGNLAAACVKYGARLVHVSTDFVFDGKGDRPYLPSDEARPMSVYGESKLAGELAAARKSADYLIVRTSWLFGKGGKNFVKTISELAGERDYLEVVNDQLGSPTYSVDLAEGLLHLIKTGVKGIYHFRNEGQCTWFEFAREIVRQLGLATQVRPVSTQQMARPAARPGYSVLDIAEYGRATGQKVRSWQDALRDYLARMRQTD